MALIDPESTQTLDIPHEPGQWLKIRPLMTQDMNDGDSSPIKLMSAAIIEWSYDAPVTPANVARLDLQTSGWLLPLITEASGLRSDEKKDSSDSPSSAGPEPVTAGSPAMSLT